MLDTRTLKMIRYTYFRHSTRNTCDTNQTEFAAVSKFNFSLIFTFAKLWALRANGMSYTSPGNTFNKLKNVY